MTPKTEHSPGDPFLSFRVKPALKEACDRLARAEEMSLAAWLRRELTGIVREKKVLAP